MGHEAGDLRRLLELYGRWQRRLFPHCEFDDFVERLEKLSSSSTLKVRPKSICMYEEMYEEPSWGKGCSSLCCVCWRTSDGACAHMQ